LVSFLFFLQADTSVCLMDFFVEEAIGDVTTSGDPRVSAIAGACAGLAEHCGMFPIDTVKTHQQLTGTTSITSTVRSIVSQRGVLGLFRGLPVVLFSVAPIHAMSFSVYELFKSFSGANNPSASTQQLMLGWGISGIAATLTHDAFLVPADTIKQRLQYSGKSKYRGVPDCTRHLLKQGGVGIFFRGYTTTAVMNLPYASLWYSSYEVMKKWIKRWTGHQHQTNDPVSHMLAGAVGGGIAAALTNPLDVAKTMLQVGSDAGKEYRGMFRTLLVLWKDLGMRGFTQGIRPRMLVHSLSAAVCWTTYEHVKFVCEKFFAETKK